MAKKRDPDWPMFDAWNAAGLKLTDDAQKAFFAGYRAAARDARRTVEYLMIELMDEAIPLGEMHAFVRSVRRTIDENGAVNYWSPALLRQPAEALTRALLTGEGIDILAEGP